GCKSVVDGRRIRMLGGEPVVDGDDLGVRPPADLRGQVSGEEGVPHHVHAAVEVKNNVARFDSFDRELGGWDAPQRGCGQGPVAGTPKRGPPWVALMTKRIATKSPCANASCSTAFRSGRPPMKPCSRTTTSSGPSIVPSVPPCHLTLGVKYSAASSGWWALNTRSTYSRASARFVSVVEAVVLNCVSSRCVRPPPRPARGGSIRGAPGSRSRGRGESTPSPRTSCSR